VRPVGGLGGDLEFTISRPLFTVTAPMPTMRVLLFLSVLTCLFCTGCSNKYGDDPSKQGLPEPVATPVPIATPIEKGEG